jgi:hypothetical protein
MLIALFGCASSDDKSDGLSRMQDEVGSAGSAARADEREDDQAARGNEREPAAGGGGEPAGGGTQPGEEPMAMDECDLDTGWDGDEYCILPPPADEGFQLHIGPTDYENPEPQYVLEPGGEATDSFSAISGNEMDIHFLYRQFRIRPGTHHMIITAGGSAGSGIDSGFGGRRIGTANHSADNPIGGVIAPENIGVGIPLAPRTTLNVSVHSINVTDQPIIRELWTNFWYRDSSQVTETATQLFAVGDPSFVVNPGQDTILGPYTCDINAEGRMLWFYGHRHANNKRFSAWRVRDGQRDLFYEGLDWEETLLLEYTSLIENPLPDRDAGIEGGWSGILDLMPGDQLEWECHVVNNNDTPLRFTNNTYTGEMCIMDAELVGTNCTSSGGFGGFSP